MEWQKVFQLSVVAIYGTCILAWMTNIFNINTNLNTCVHRINNKPLVLFLQILVTLSSVTIFIYILAPSLIEQFMLDIPVVLRLLGMMCGFLAVSYFLWELQSLKISYKTQFKKNVDQVEVSFSPGSLNLSAIYMAFFGISGSIWLISSNWLVGMASLCCILVLISMLQHYKKA